MSKVFASGMVNSGFKFSVQPNTSFHFQLAFLNFSNKVGVNKCHQADLFCRWKMRFTDFLQRDTRVAARNPLNQGFLTGGKGVNFAYRGGNFSEV